MSSSLLSTLQCTEAAAWDGAFNLSRNASLAFFQKTLDTAYKVKCTGHRAITNI